MILILAILLLLFNVNYQANAKNGNETSGNGFDQSQLIVNTHDTKIHIKNQKEIIVDETLIFENKQISSFTHLNLWLNQSYRDLKIEGDMGSLTYEISNTSSLITIDLLKAFNPNQTTLIYMTYYLDLELTLIEGKPSYYDFKFLNLISYFTEIYTVEVRLPSNSFVHEKDDIVPYPYWPEDANVQAIGNKIILSWEFKEIEPPFNQLIMVYFNEAPSGKPLIWLMVVGPLFGLITGAGGVFYFMRMRETKIYSELEKVYITDNQKILLGLINEKDGKTTQKELVEITGFTKSKISRNLTPLEEKGLISREKWGREYKVYITATGKKLIKSLVAEKFPNDFKETQTDISKGEKEM